MDLQKLLESYRHANIRTEWSYRNLRDVPIMGTDKAEGELAATPSSTNVFVEKLKKDAASDGKQLYIVPVNSWYRDKYNTGSFSKKNLNQEAKKLSEWSHIPVCEDIVKVNYTADTFSADRMPPSYFVGNVPPNSRVILLDDQITSGKTLRDMARFVEGTGAEVIAFSSPDYQSMVGKYPFRSKDQDDVFALLYACSHSTGNVSLGEARKQYGALSAEQRDAFEQECSEAANPVLNALGISLNQLVHQELVSLLLPIADLSVKSGIRAKYLPNSNSEEKGFRPIDDLKSFMSKAIDQAGIQAAVVPKAEDIHKPDELAAFIEKSRHLPGGFRPAGVHSSALHR